MGPNMCKLCEIINQATGNTLNCANVNLYQNEKIGISWHADDEKIFKNKKKEKINIVSISFLSARLFEIRKKKSKKVFNSFFLEPWTLYEMSGCFQEEFQHRIPFSDIECGWRLNITFRQITQHDPKCCCFNN